MLYDLLTRGGTRVDGTGVPGRPADVGVAGENAFADLVVFDPAIVGERSTEQPARYPIGIEHVVVNGALAVNGGEETGVDAGRLLRR